MGSWTEICYIACIDVCICCADRCLGRGELGLVGWLGRVVMQMELYGLSKEGRYWKTSSVTSVQSLGSLESQSFKSWSCSIEVCHKRIHAWARPWGIKPLRYAKLLLDHTRKHRQTVSYLKHWQEILRRFFRSKFGGFDVFLCHMVELTWRYNSTSYLKFDHPFSSRWHFHLSQSSLLRTSQNWQIFKEVSKKVSVRFCLVSSSVLFH